MRLIDADALHDYYRMVNRAQETEWQKGFWDGVDNMLAAVDELPTVGAAPQWVSVKERLPEDERLVLGLMLGKFCFVGSCRPSDKTWFCATQSAAHPCKKEVTHWMPLPEAPKENADAEET